MERNPLDAANAKRRQPVLILQAAKLTLDRGAATVKLTEPLRRARNERVGTVGLAPGALGRALPGGTAVLGGVTLEVSPCEQPRSVLARWNGGSGLADVAKRDDRADAAFLATR